MMITHSLIRQTPRCFSTSSRGNSPGGSFVPGLHIFHDFLPKSQQSELQKKAIDLYKAVLNTQVSSDLKRRKIFLSHSHNLKSDEYYRLIEIEDVPGKKIRGQHFEKYGEDGHKLTYFIGNNNLPKFLRNSLVPRVLQIPEVMALRQDKTLNCNFTFNTYAKANERASKLAGFGFHKDIESNGELTVIYSIGAHSEFQIRYPNDEDKALTIPLLSHSLILLSKGARWDYEHRVIPVTIEDCSPLFQNEVETIRRISLVLGFAG
ncbi:MAG: hypothetical protein Tsb0021_01590 [Chlamydiales bacterium]